MAIQTVSDFFNKLCSELDKTYFPDVKYYRDDKRTTDIHYAVELFNNGVIPYPVLLTRLTNACNADMSEIKTIVDKYLIFT